VNWLGRFFRKRHFPVAETTANIRKQIWSIGIYLGDTPFDLKSPESVDNPVLTHSDVSDISASYVADPFMIMTNGMWFMFFEVMNGQTGNGEIGLASSKNCVDWTYQQIVLTEPFHLSYPYVFEWMSEYYMIPENAKPLRLYKALAFPYQWSFVGTMLTGQRFIDASVFQYDGKWWLFTETNPNLSFDTLRLYFADDLLGPWVEHPRSPIVEGNRLIARPAGRVLVDDKLLRYCQNCEPHYGSQVRAFEILELSTSSYREREISMSPVLTGSGRGWNESGMHHIDAHRMPDGGWIACVDGWRWPN